MPIFNTDTYRSVFGCYLRKRCNMGWLGWDYVGYSFTQCPLGILFCIMKYELRCKIGTLYADTSGHMSCAKIWGEKQKQMVKKSSCVSGHHNTCNFMLCEFHIHNGGTVAHTSLHLFQSMSSKLSYHGNN